MEPPSKLHTPELEISESSFIFSFFSYTRLISHLASFLHPKHQCFILGFHMPLWLQPPNGTLCLQSPQSDRSIYQIGNQKHLPNCAMPLLKETSLKQNLTYFTWNAVSFMSPKTFCNLISHFQHTLTVLTFYHSSCNSRSFPNFIYA